eukprot:CAMPEP_0198502838 /NCGR_PEP_ID=MMETSP1462-20131121/9547_1 /TAXON_ID=1333877 /ORGANISM="Brandtodinium nutriculum, Strain RCC3387" /LENGTH=66 /DNA_ID=CAMNT_0044231937 /DNA_START=53 /DNA_END=249 /DNA_ORIENTATION=-
MHDALQTAAPPPLSGWDIGMPFAGRTVRAGHATRVTLRGHMHRCVGFRPRLGAGVRVRSTGGRQAA